MRNLNLGYNFGKKFESVMANELQKEWSMCNTNLYERLPSCWIHPYIQLHYSVLRPGAHGQHF